LIFVVSGGNLNMGKSDVRTGVSSLSDLYGDLFTLILYLRETSNFGDPKILHDKIDAMFKSVESKAKQLNIFDDDVLSAKYAVSALVDETVLYSNWSLRNVWLNNPLVVEYFNDALAGEMFFDKLETLRNDESKLNVLEVYYMCLMFGFEGKYKIIGSDELKVYMNGIKEILKFKGTDKLSPHAELQKVAMKKKSMIPRWVVYASYGLVALIAIVIFIVFKVKMMSLANVIAAGIAKI
jgi:type VI secretion system protein ImpK